MLPLRSSTSTGSFSGTLGPASLRRRIRRRWRPINAVGLALLAVVAICALVALWTRSNMSAAELRTGDGEGLRGKGRMQLRRNARLDLRTLVIYVYSGSDPEYESNLMYFLREGVKVSSGGQVPTFQPLRQHLQVSISSNCIMSQSRPFISGCQAHRGVAVSKYCRDQAGQLGRPFTTARAHARGLQMLQMPPCNCVHGMWCIL